MLEIDNISQDADPESEPNPLYNNEIISPNEHNLNLFYNIEKKYNKLLYYLYYIFIHIFIFSVFESLFFWLYIAKEEDEAIYKQIEDIILFGDLFCDNTNDDIDLSSLYDYQKDKRQTYNNIVPLNNTLLLNGYLLSFLLILNLLMKVSKVNIFEINYIILKEQSGIFILLFFYEYLFFSNIVYNYVPNSVDKVVKKIFNKCF
uniref:Uncharacterized protein n=1 Tax=Florenciella sp. virus SA2 TaxID=3240092 RepID=A0AB39JEZ9_9VIRU